MASEVFQLAILLSVKDAASGGLDRFSAKLRAMGKTGIEAEKQLDKIRANLNRDLAIGGVGLAGLGLIKNGVDAAGNFQASMTDLRTTLAQTSQSGQVDLNALGQDMLKAEAIAVKLGNALPGTTEDFVSMIQTLKQGGLETKTIFDGAAEAVGNLAVANNAAPKDMAKDFAKFAQIYKLSAEETKGAADIFSRIYTSKGIDSGELIQSSKYFQGRAGSALKMTGLKGADESVRLMGYLQKQGLDSSQAGTSASTFFVQLAKNKKALAELKEDYGVTFDLFDKKGEFKGIDNAVSELQKLKKLNPEQMLVALNKLGGEEGAMAGTAIVSGGVEGWKQFNAEVNSSISLTDKTAMKAKDYNNQMESLSGTLTNLKVTVFEPMLPSLTSAAQGLNTVVGAVQGFAKENPNLSKTVITLTAMASSAMVLYSGFKTLSTGVQLFKLASTVSSGGGLLQYLGQSKVAADAAGASIGNATGKARGLRGALQSQTVKIGVQIGAIMGIEFLIGVIQSEIQTALNAGDSKKGAVDATNKNYGAFQQAEKSGVKFDQKDFEGQANTSWFSAMQQGLKYTMPSQFANLPSMEKFGYAAKSTFLHPLTRATGSTNPFAEGLFGKQTIAEGFKKTTPELADSRIMTSFLRQLETRVPEKGEQQAVKQGLQTAFPESFTAAMRELSGISFTPLTQSLADLSQQAMAQQQNTEIFNQQGQTVQTFGQNLNNLQQPISAAQQNLTNVGEAAGRVPPPMFSVANSANGAAVSLDSLSGKISSWQMPVPNVQTITIPVPGAAAPGGISTVPSHAVGGVVERDGLAQVHAGNVITPARTKGFGAVAAMVRSADDKRKININDAKSIVSSRNTQNVKLNYSPQITINGDSKTAQADFQAMLNQHSKEIDRIVARRLDNGRQRA